MMIAAAPSQDTYFESDCARALLLRKSQPVHG